jgi:endonuclease YncB( thermonuclease family)
MSLNRRRRIFRSDATSAPAFGARLSRPVFVVAVLGGATLTAAAVSLLIRPAHAPAQSLSAEALSPNAPTFGAPTFGDPPAGFPGAEASHQQLSAPADKLAVIDGDTLRIGEHVVRLEGIAAPARGSVCRGTTAGDQDCGVAAANTLASLLRGNPVDCTVHGADQLGRPVAACLSAGVPLSQALVRRGWARAQTAALRQTEEAARADGLGMWHSLGGS